MNAAALCMAFDALPGYLLCCPKSLSSVVIELDGAANTLCDAQVAEVATITFTSWLGKMMHCGAEITIKSNVEQPNGSSLA